MPNIPKPAAARQRRNHVVLMDAHEVAVIPDPPKGLLKATREAWRGFWSSNVARVVQPEDVPALQRLFEHYDDRARLMKQVRHEGFDTVGSKGQTILNPILRHVSALEPAITKLEDRFGLTPLSKIQLSQHFNLAAETAMSLEKLNAGLAEANDSDSYSDEEWEEDPEE